MKKLLLTIIFVLLLSGTAFSESGFEFDLGYFSPNKGVAGIRYSSAPILSFGLIWGGPLKYTDFGIAASYHFWNDEGPYAFQSHHWLNSDVGNVWEINTGVGYQFIFFKRFLVYSEVGVPLYIGGWSVWRYYDGGIPYNRNYGDLVLTSFRTGLGVGYLFRFF
jgi:hypothetical protein